MGQVVDVLGGAGEVDELADRFQLRQFAGLPLEQIFDSLYIKIGGAFDFLDALCVAELEVIHQTVQHRVSFVGERLNPRYAGVRRQKLQPSNLNMHSEQDQT